MTSETVHCPYCSAPAAFIASSAELYHGRDFGPVYVCRPCAAWVGCHKGTTRPLGRLANAELRQLKQRVHAVLDPLWVKYWLAYPEMEKRSGRMRGIQRGRVYAWLAVQLGIPNDECHIGMFGPERCRDAIAVLEREHPTPASIRTWAKQQHGEAA